VVGEAPVRVVAVAMILAAWLMPALAASPGGPAVSPADKQAGCLRNDLRPCMLALGSTLWFDMNLVAPQIARRNELDVNGRTAHRTVTIDAAVPGHHEMISIVLTLASPAPDDRVVKAAVTLPQDPDLAHTPSEYDRTFLYDAVSVLFGRLCPSLDRMALYRFYENDLKPREIVKTEILKNGIFNRTRMTVDTDKVPFCGVMFSLHRQAEWDGTPDFKGRGRDRGGIAIIDLE
jgi:hypothetical protein